MPMLFCRGPTEVMMRGNREPSFAKAAEGRQGTGNNGWEVHVHGGRTATGKDAVEWAVEAARLGAGEILLTSMDRDGTKEGYDLELLREVTSRVTIPVIASGGVGTLEHLRQGIESGASAVLAASIFHYGQYSIPEAKRYLKSKGIHVRITG